MVIKKNLFFLNYLSFYDLVNDECDSAANAFGKYPSVEIRT
jgi:hypothetical protein